MIRNYERRKIEVYLKEKYPHMNELDDYIVDEIHKYRDGRKGRTQ